MTEKVLERPCCLIVEDQVLSAIPIETFLERAGIAVQAVGSVGHARAWLKTNTPDIAIVAFSLDDRSARELAKVLDGRGIPFVIYSGYRLTQGVPTELPKLLCLKKPISHDDLLKIVLKILIALPGQVPSAPALNS
jgi:DNA-binding NtrC family response regulator